MRLFIAIDLPSEIKKFLSEVNTAIEEIQGIKIVNPENMHLTLLFLGNTDPKKINEKIKNLKFKQFYITIKRIGFFPNRNRIRIMWFGVERNMDLFHLQKILSEKFNDYNNYVPHLTFARAKFLNPLSKKVLFKILEKHKDKEFRFKVDKFRLYSSDLTPLGPVHRVVETIHAK